MDLIVLVVSLLAYFSPAMARYTGKPSGCQNNPLDILQGPGAYLEKDARSHVRLEHFNFPVDSKTYDSFSLEFKTKDMNGLIFHAQSHNQLSELTAWISDGYLMLRLRGQCSWYVISNRLSLDKRRGKFVSDGAFHKIEVFAKSDIQVRVDGGSQHTFPITTMSGFSRECWDVNTISFGAPGHLFTKGQFRYVKSRYPEYYERMDLCVRSVSKAGGDITKTPKYRRVSSCT